MKNPERAYKGASKSSLPNLNNKSYFTILYRGGGVYNISIFKNEIKYL